MSELLTPQSELLTPQEAAEFFRWSAATVYSYASRRKIPSVKVLGSLRFRREELERLVTARRRKEATR